MASASKAKFFRRTVLIGLMCLFALAIVLYVMRVPLLEFAGKTGLSVAGFEDVTVTVEEVSTDQIQISELLLGDQISLQNVALRYQPIALLKGEVAAIDIENLFVDLSDPDGGAIGRLRQIAGDGTQDGDGNAGERTFPAISVRAGKIVANNERQSFEAAVSGAITAEMMLKGEGSLNGRVVTAGGPILIENMVLSVDADIPARSGEFFLGGGRISHAVDTPDWAPLLLSGAGKLAGEHLTGRMTIKTTDGQPLMQFEGDYDIASNTGRAQLALEDLVFRMDGLQPSDISRYAKDVPPIDGRLNITAAADVDNASVTFKADISFDELTVGLPEGQAAAARVPIQVSGRYALEDNELNAEATLTETNIDLGFRGRSYALENLRSTATLSGFADSLQLVSLEGAVRDRAKLRDFAPFFFTARGEMDAARAISFAGEMRDIASKLEVNFDGTYKVDEGTGAISLQLPETRVGKDGISLTALSRHLKGIGEAFSGTVTAKAQIDRLADGALIASSVSAAVKDGGWTQGDIVASGLGVQLQGMQPGSSAPFAGQMNGQVDKLVINGQPVSIEAFATTFSGMLRNLSPPEDASLEIARLRIAPLKGAIFKETQTATGTATLKKDDVLFSIRLASDYLGSFAHITGRHSLSGSKGEAAIQIDPLTFDKEGLQPGDLIAIEGDIMVDGRILPSAKLYWAPGGLNGSADIGVRNVTVKSSGGEISGLNGDIHIDEIFPLSIATAQEITAGRAVAGIPIKEPFVRFRVLTRNGAPVLFIDRLTAGIVGGAAFIEQAVIDTGAKINRVEVQLTHLDLEEVMALSNVEELVATGKVSGRIPLVFGGERLVVDGGLLAAEGPGILKMTSEAARRALGGGGDQAKLLLDILENFHYSELSIEVMKTEGGDDTVKLHAAGGNPDVENNRPVVLNINLSTSLDKIFNAVLDGYLLSEKALRATVGNR